MKTENLKKTMTKKEKLTLVRKAYDRLDRACITCSDWPKYLALVQKAERDYRRMWREMPLAIPLKDCVALMAVYQVFKCFAARSGEKIRVPDPADYFFVRPDVFGAWAISQQMKAEILGEFPLAEMEQWLGTIDYADMVKL